MYHHIKIYFEVTQAAHPVSDGRHRPGAIRKKFVFFILPWLVSIFPVSRDSQRVQ